MIDILKEKKVNNYNILRFNCCNQNKKYSIYCRDRQNPLYNLNGEKIKRCDLIENIKKIINDDTLLKYLELRYNEYYYFDGFKSLIKLIENKYDINTIVYLIVNIIQPVAIGIDII